MRKRTTLTLLMLMMAFLATLVPAKRVGAWETQETRWTVYYNCIIGPYPGPGPHGEWERDCEGNTTGWGMQPYDNCTRTEVSYGNMCEISTP